MLTAKWIRYCLALLAVVALPAAVVFAEEEGPDVDDILATLTEQLELTDDQQPQVKAALQEFMVGLSKATEETEGGEEDGAAKLTKVKEARDTFIGKMKEILTEEQFTKFETLVDQTMAEMFNDIAGIKLIDLQPALELTDEQVEQLEPVMGKGYRSMLAVIMDNVDKKLRMPQKIKVGKKLKGIQSDMDSGMKEIMTEEQWAKYEEMKEAQKEAKEEAKEE